MAHFTISQARRLNQLIEESGKTKKALASAIGVDQSVLTKITGPKALNKANEPRPMMHADKLLLLCLELGTTTEFVFGVTDEIDSVMERHRKDMLSLTDKISTELAQHVRKKNRSNNVRPSVDDVLSWWRQTGGVAGHGHDIEDYFDIVKRPSVTDTFVQPLRMGPHALAAQKYGTTDIARFTAELKSWPQETHDVILAGYYELANAGASFTGTQMEVVIDGKIVPYLSLRLEVDYLGSDEPAALCLAVEVEGNNSVQPGKKPLGSPITTSARC